MVLCRALAQHHWKDGVHIVLYRENSTTASQRFDVRRRRRRFGMGIERGIELQSSWRIQMSIDTTTGVKLRTMPRAVI